MIDRGRADAEGVFAFIAEHTSDVIVRFSACGEVLYVSPAVRRYGFEPEELVGPGGALVHPEDAESLRANNAALLSGEVNPASRRAHRFRAKNGDWIWMEGNPQVIRDAAGEVVEIVNIFRDVTHRHALEAEAQAQAEQFEAAFRHAAIGMALVGLDGSFLRLNDAFCRIVGYPQSELRTLDFQTITHPDDLHADLDQLRQLTAGEIDRYGMDKRYIRAGGQQVWVHLSVSMVCDADGAPKHYVAQVQDLTERRRAEDALRTSEARYRVLAEASEDVTAQVNLAGEITYISPAARNYGYDPEALVGGHMIALLHPDDVGRAVANLAAIAAGETTSAWERTIRVRTQGGDWVWMEGNAQVLRDAAGSPTGYVTTLRNVTERMEQDALFEAAFEEAAQGKSIIAVGGPALRANKAACRLLGYTEAELQAVLTTDLLHPEDVGKDAEASQRLIRGETTSYETLRRIRRADGTYVPLRLTIALVRNADGSPKHFVTEFEDLTERHAAEAALKASEERYRLIAENTSDMIVVSTLRGRAQYVSQSVSQAGQTPDGLTGRSFAESVHPDDRGRMMDAFKSLLADGKPERVRWRGVDSTRPGGWSWLESNPSLMRDSETGEVTGFLDVIRNVQHQVEQEEALGKATAALQASEARYRLIGENTSDIIVMADTNGRITYISPSISSIGYTAEELIGAAFIKQMHPDDLKRVWPACSGLPAGATAPRMRWRAKHKQTGEWVWLESQPTMLKDPETGGAGGFLDVVRDVSRQVEQEEALARARGEAEDAAAAKSQFLANMSHEIRTPLTAVLGFTSLLKEIGGLPEAASGYVDRIAGAGKGLLAIVNDILDFSKLEAGKFEIRPRPTDVSAVAEETLMLFSNQAEAKGLALAFEAAPGVPRAVMLDGDRLRQTLINLIGNAIKFTEAGSVRVAVAPAEGEAVAVWVSDTGPGLDAESQARLFQRFTQIDGSMTRRHGGTGLGLAICKGIAEAMGGEIGVESTLDEGATFYLVLPAPPVDAPLELVGDDAPLSIDGTRVFLVDDNATNRELARRILEAAGAEVQEAADGVEAIERLALLPVDVVLMDLRMPRLDGRGALARLRATTGPNQAAPVLAFTADADLAGENDLDGFDGLVRKPIQPLELYSAIAAATQWPLQDEDVTYAAG